jgi:hypothetical protein
MFMPELEAPKNESANRHSFHKYDFMGSPEQARKFPDEVTSVIGLVNVLLDVVEDIFAVARTSLAYGIGWILANASG